MPTGLCPDCHAVFVITMLSNCIEKCQLILHFKTKQYNNLFTNDINLHIIEKNAVEMYNVTP